MIDKNSTFFTLTANNNIELKVYEEALDYIFKKNDIRNVSIAGPYGAGKSSVLATYKNIHKEKNFLHISLSHYQAEGIVNDYEEDVKINKPKKESDIKELNNIIEGKIINQLIHQIDENDIPCTNFKVKKDTKKTKSLLITFQYFIEILFLVFLFSYWTELVESVKLGFLNDFISLTTKPNLIIIVFFMFLFNSFIILYNLLIMLNERSIFKKATIKGLEVEVFDNDNDSYFDKYLNEVLYLFKKVKADVIVFEDIDRYNSYLVFEHLREINTLVNFKRNEKPLRFFYLTRDDIFENKERTKFFDFIIPIVPVVDGSNSYDKFLECFSERGVFANATYKLDEGFMQGLLLYINDMRLLKNICNELIIYQKSIFSTEQCSNKMFALITYKNLFPKDFAQLQLNQGFLFEILGGNGKRRLISLEMNRISEQEKNTNKTIDDIGHEYITKDELAVIYLFKLLKEAGVNNYSLIKSPEQCRESIEERRRYNDQMQLYAEYDKRINYCSEGEEDKKNRILQLEQELSELALSKQNLKESNLKEVITRENIDELFKAEYVSETGLIESFNTIKDSPYFSVIKYLVREGYIDETYPDYLTFFYGNSVTAKDKIFLRSVTDGKAKEENYKLDNPKLVVSRLPVKYFDQIETLNLDILSFFILNYESDSECKPKAKKYIEQLKTKKKYDFIVNYYNKTKDDDSLICLLGEYWKSFISEIFSECKVVECPSNPASKYDIFLGKFITNFLGIIGLNESKINCLDDESMSKLQIYISNDYRFFTKSSNTDDFIEGLSLLKIKFKNINIDSTSKSKSLLDRIFRDNLYEINIGNISTIVKEYFKEDYEYFYTENYSIIMKNSNSPLELYINESGNINKYIEVILDNCNEKITDNNDCVLSILNNEIIMKENKSRYINYLQSAKLSFSDIKDKSIWPYLLRNVNVIKYTAENIINYFVEHCKDIFDETLYNYINSKDEAVIFDGANYSLDLAVREKFFDAIVICNNLEDDIYKNMISQFDCYYDGFTFTDITEGKIKILDEMGKFKMTEENLNFIRKNHAQYLIAFINNHVDDYVNLYANKANEENEIIDIIQSKIRDEDKVKILYIYKSPISIKDKDLTSKISNHILNYNYSEEDFVYIANEYSSFSKNSQMTILGLAEKNMVDKTLILKKIDQKLILDLLKSYQVELKNKRELFKRYFESAGDKEIKDWLPLVNSSKFLDVFNKNKKPKFENNEWNIIVLGLFKKKGYISKYTIDKNSLNISISRKSF